MKYIPEVVLASLLPLQLIGIREALIFVVNKYC